MCLVPIISGIGLISPLGASALQTWDALIAGRFITDHARAVGCADGADRIHALAASAVGEALDDAGWLGRPIESARTALVVGTSKGAIETWLTPPPVTSDNSASAGEARLRGLASLSAHLRGVFPSLDGTAITLSSACASGLHALIRGVMMIRSGEADRVMVIGAEASVHPLFLASFKRLGVLPREGIGCRPFDRDRDGFLMSEAAAAVCLESIKKANPDRTAYARVDRFALGGDATHMTGGDPHGQLLRRLLGRVVAQRMVDLVQAHGTGTTFNDPIELSAIDELCGSESPPAIYSHKGALGHSLGAAGLVSIALNCLMHRRQIIPPNIQTHHPLPVRRLLLGREVIERPIRSSVAMAAGFGGPTAIVSLRSI
jgi:3-oxoacyl-[acyl-carrier-protein] synthase II